MRANSLALRLFVTATLWTVVILFGTAILLSSLYRQAVERSFDHRLSVYLRSLVADVASPDVSPERFPQSLGEPLFELPLSGWYWQVTRLDGSKDVRTSRSRAMRRRSRQRPMPSIRRLPSPSARSLSSLSSPPCSRCGSAWRR